MHKTLVQTLLAAFCAVLATAPLEGGGVMPINMRNALLSGKRTPTAKDYVQDGLVAMWDGIENAGWGQHDDNATVWKDLIGNKDLTLTTAGKFVDNHLACNGTKYAAYSNGGMSGIITQEIGFKRYSGTIIAQYMSAGCNGYYVGLKGGITCNSSDVTSFPIIHDFATYTYVFASPWRLMQNGVPPTRSFSDYTNFGRRNCVAIGGRDASASGASVVDVLFYRLYSHALTTDEIAANYAVDKARFNLPDAT